MLSLLLTSLAAAPTTMLVIDGDVPWCVPNTVGVPSEVTSDALNDTATGMAFRDVELDWYKRLGYRAIITPQSEFTASNLRNNGNATALFLGDVNSHPELESTFNLTARGCGLAAGAESHCVLVITGGYTWRGSAISGPAIVAVGNGTRGAIFAAYAFAEHVLNVAPFHKFTFDEPLYAAATGGVVAIPSNTALIFPPPHFKNRAMFLNDEELLGFYRRDPLGEQVFDPSTLDDILSTLLRAKANTIILGTTPYPDERSLRLAARRGVIITASHFEILGFNAFAWSKAFGEQSRELWDWKKHPDLMSHVWKATIAAQKNYEMVWSIGLRGLNDYAYPYCVPDGEGADGCGAVISDAVANQTALLQEVTGKSLEELDFKFNLWVEALPLYEKGLLKLPKHTSLIMSDSGAGFIRGDANVFANADGVYYHVQMLNGNGGQISEFVPPSRIFEQLSSFVRQARSTTTFVLNLSDLKPAVLSAAAALAFVYDPRPYTVNGSASSPVGNQTAGDAEAKFMSDWTGRNFRGVDAATQQKIANAWTAYFELPWIVRGESDEHLAGAIGGLASGLASDLQRNWSVSSKTMKDATNAFSGFVISGGLQNATALHTSVAALHPLVTASRLQFFQSHILVQSAIQRYASFAAVALSNATVALSVTATPSKAAVTTAQGYVADALTALDALFAAERAAEGGSSSPWRGMYWADRHRFTNFQARRREVLRLQATLASGSSGAAKDAWSPATMIDCCQMEYAYQWTPKHLASYPLMYDDPVWRVRDFVMTSCLNVTKGGGSCNATRNGGLFHSNAAVTLAAPAVSGVNDTMAKIMYSLDGSEPSTVFIPGGAAIVLTATTTIRCKLVREKKVSGGVGDDAVVQERSATFVRV